MKSTTAVKDLVCGMVIETATAAGRTEHKGQTYYFCGAKCKEICGNAEERPGLLQLNPINAL
jgi:YHS domain-containing protein